ncbi:MAG: AAA family ATPase [Armatimonadetes bacterium]|nr:AAA family ATPase [Armatimonadota bacterium]
MALPLVRVTQIGEYVRHHSCERRFKLDQDNRRLTKSLPFFYTLSGAMDPALEEAGRAREREWEGRLARAGLRDLGDGPDAEATPWDVFAARVAGLGPGQEAFGREVEVSGQLGAFQVIGRIDFALLLWRGGTPTLRLVECKASRKDKTYQRVQLALYRNLVRRRLEARPLEVAGRRVDPEAIECVVARSDAETNAVQDMLVLPPLDLTMEEADAAQLLAGGGPLEDVLARDIADIPYQLDAKCDDCALNVYCLPEAARRREIELLGVDAGAARALRAAGVADIDALADLALDSEAARRVRADAGFGESLDVLTQKAKVRRSTLPGASEPEVRDVMPLPHAGSGQLPPHVTGGRRLVRIFLSVHFDYVENRIGAISAHVTRSERPLSTLFRQEEGGPWRPDPDVQEQWKTDAGTFQERRLQGTDIVGIIPKPWTGELERDSRREAEMLQGFFGKVVAAVRDLCPEGHAPLHFYVWSQSEITRLVEACARTDSDLLGSLRELLGCREGLEQLIYSCLSDEVDGRYALGWTSRGLAAATSLRWFGRRFHWMRRIGEEEVALDKVFAEGIFDFKTTLKYGDDGAWRGFEDTGAHKHAFEVRACFQDALPAPYWRAYWGTLPDSGAPGMDPKRRAAIRAFQGGDKPLYLRTYLKARGQALRWIEESVQFKNQEIVKPAVDIAGLPRFTLGVQSAAQAVLDFLRLEQHVAANDWTAGHLRPPAQRVPSGRTLPLRDVRVVEENRLAATVDLAGYPLTPEVLAKRCGLGEGAFVRLSPCADDPQRGQTLAQLLRGGSTCRVERLDWEAGEVELSVLPYRREDRYILPSRAWPLGSAGYARATLDESLSDFVAGRVDERLRSGQGGHVARWFDPTHPAVPPQIPIPDDRMARYRALLTDLDLGRGPLAPDQREAVLAGLNARVQLLQGPPGTGKTQTTAAAALLRILARHAPGDLILVTGNTHTAVDTLLERMESLLPCFHAAVPMPPVRVAKVGSASPEPSPGAVAVLGGTPNALLRLARATGLTAPMLIVDEASMMVLPYFLAVASLVREDGEILLAGDHRQLAPIMAHDWEREERPPARLYQPHVSAYEAVRRLAQSPGVPDAAILQSALTHTFRLPPAICDLIARLYRLDDIALTGRTAESSCALPPSPDLWRRLWQPETGLFLVVHDERDSRQSNPLEAHLVRAILDAAGPLAAGSVGVVVPHRAQRGLLGNALRGHAAVGVIDTVERFQGGERETIIVSATASDPAAITARAEFLLGLNRANVSFSRARKRLIVVCSERLLAHIPPRTEHYAEALLWKSLRAVCSERVGEATADGHRVRVWEPPAG